MTNRFNLTHPQRRLAKEMRDLAKIGLSHVFKVKENYNGKIAFIQMGKIHFSISIDEKNGYYPFQAPGFLYLGGRLLKEVVEEEAQKKGFDDCLNLMLAVDFPTEKWFPAMTFRDIYESVKRIQNELDQDWSL